jgi:NAD(P)-dependent dehydrogenase (short-subunit alcohol dehydrogenase family)
MNSEGTDMTETQQTKAWLNLAGQVCVVTGGGSGIGADTARQLAAVGASVAILDRNEAAALRVAGEIEDKGGRAIGIGAEVSNKAAITAAGERVQKELGPCQVLVNCAAILQSGPLISIDLEKWNQALTVNLTGALICTQVFAAQMIKAESGGSLIHIASIAGEFPMPDGGGYSVSKAGLNMLSRMFSLELAPHGIRSNIVIPALVRTPFSEFAYQDPDLLKRRQALIPLDRIGTPRDIADAVVFLSSERSSYITGQKLVVDGGISQVLMRQIPKPAMPKSTN